MILQGSDSIYKQITRNRQSLLSNMPKPLRKAIVSVWDHRYEELYESDSDGTVLLEDSLGKILDSFQGSNRLLSQLRYVWMALTLAAAVEPTVKYYQPDSLIPEEAIERLTNWLFHTLTELFNSSKQLSSGLENIESVISADFNSFLSTQNISSFQVLSEALDVYINAIKTLEPDHSLQALLNILDDCLEGYAIFPGSYGRRELFNWWLLDVVPSCWYLLPPASVYSLNDVEIDDKSSPLNRLEEISSLIWSLIGAAIQNQTRKGKDLLELRDNTLLISSDEVEVQINNQLVLSGNENIESRF